MSNQHPTQEQIRDARRQGFRDSTRHIQDDRRNKLYGAYKEQDSRREKNVSQFVNTITGS